MSEDMEKPRDAIEPQVPAAAEGEAGDNVIAQDVPADVSNVINVEGGDNMEEAGGIDPNPPNMDEDNEWLKLEQEIMHIERLKREEKLREAFEKLRMLLPGVGHISTLKIVTTATSYIMHLENLQALHRGETPPHLLEHLDYDGDGNFDA